MRVTSSSFMTSAAKAGQYPPEGPPEVAFTGRSNSGKSSLINRLLNRRRLVKTGARPGRTQLINFFEINGAFRFVDLPGYGYARVPLEVRRRWGPMVETYVSGRATLRAVVWVMDLRRTPGSEEHRLAAWLQDLDIALLPVLTKADKLSRNRQARQLGLVARELNRDRNELVLFSARSGLGCEALWEKIAAHIDTRSVPKA